MNQSEPEAPPSCETCEKYPCEAIQEASKTISSAVISDMLLVLLKEFTTKVGCASHPRAREWLNWDVIKELERCRAQEKFFPGETAEDAHRISTTYAIKLLKEGVPK